MSKLQTNFISLAALLSLGALVTSMAQAEEQWKFGVGSGLFALNIEGDLGINVDSFGPVEFDVDLDYGDISDYNESGFGASFSATKGKLRYQFTFSHLGLEGEADGVDGGALPVSALILFESNTAELSASYNFMQYAQGMLGVIGGLRYHKHGFESTVTQGAITRERNKDFTWVDGFVGLTHAYAFSRAWSWSSQVDIGAGGSDFTYQLTTGLNWMFAENWTTRLFGKNLGIDYEEKSRGDAGWYKYDMDEFGAGLAINYSW